MGDDLAAKAAIAEVVHGYALAIRHRRHEAAAALFAADGWCEVRDGEPGAPATRLRTRLDGRGAVLDYLLATRAHPVTPIPM